MKTIILILISLSTFGQKKVTDSLSYKNGSPKRQCYFNKDAKEWTCIDFYETGSPWSIYHYDTTAFNLVERKSIFDLRGELIAFFEYKNGDLNGDFKEFYLNGNIKTQGYFYNNIRQGKWIEYYSDNKIKSIKYYKVNHNENAGEIHKTDKSRINYLKITYCTRETEDEQKVILTKYGMQNMLDLKCSDEIFTIDGVRTGTWKWFDKNGKLTKTEKH